MSVAKTDLGVVETPIPWVERVSKVCICWSLGSSYTSFKCIFGASFLGLLGDCREVWHYVGGQYRVADDVSSKPQEA